MERTVKIFNPDDEEELLGTVDVDFVLSTSGIMDLNNECKVSGSEIDILDMSPQSERLRAMPRHELQILVEEALSESFREDN
jgi:hypothetical protein